MMRLYIEHMKPVHPKKLPAKKVVEDIVKKNIKTAGVVKNLAATRTMMIQDTKNGHLVSVAKNDLYVHKKVIFNL